MLLKNTMNADLTLKTVLISLCLSLGACTSSKAIRTPVADSPDLEQARTNQETGKLIRWGGTIVSVINKTDHTLIEIVERPLTRFGTPKVTTDTGGRFFAKTAEFIDPENIKSKQSITVSGNLVDYVDGMIGEHEYLYPVVEINEYKIWPQNQARYNNRYQRPFYGPYWYDPYWGAHSHWYYGHRFRHRYRHW